MSKKDKASTTTRIMPDRTEAQRLALQQRRLLEAAADDQRELREQRFDKAVPKVKRRSGQLAGAEPWEWRPPRYMGERDAGGSSIPSQPPPPTHVKTAPPGAARGTGTPLGRQRQRAAAIVSDLLDKGDLPRHQLDAIGMQIAGFSRAEIAKRMGITEGAVRGLLERGKRRLREQE